MQPQEAKASWRALGAGVAAARSGKLDPRPTASGPVLFWRAFVLQAALLVAVAWPRIVAVHLWAEDGSEFLRVAHGQGWPSLWLPYAGYYHLMPRLVARLGLLLPLAWFAPFVACVTFAVAAAVAATFASPTYRWLVANDWVRLFCGSFLLVAPGMWEVLGNLANLHTLGGVFLALLAWRHQRARWPAWLWLAFFLALGSEGSALVFALPFGWRLCAAWRKKAPYLRREAVALGFVLAWAAAHGLAARWEGQALAHLGAGQLVRGGVQLLVERWVVVPWAYAQNLLLWRNWPISWRVGTGLGGTLALALPLAARFRVGVFGLLAAPAALLGTLVVTGFVRDGAMEGLLHGWVGIYCRYGAATYLGAVILWAVALKEVSTWLGVELRGPAAALAFALACQGALPYQPFGKETNWQETSQALRHVVLDDGVYPRGHCVPHNPEPWAICLSPEGRD